MPVMSNDQIAHALEKIRSGELEADGDSDVENYLLSALHSDGQDAVGALLLNLEGMEFTLMNALEASPNSIFRSGHEDNPLTVELFATNDAAVLGISPEIRKEPELPKGHQWFYATLERLNDDDINDPLTLSEPDRTVFLIASFEADILTGGLQEYLANTVEHVVEEAIRALEKVGASTSASCLQKASRLKRNGQAWGDLTEKSGRQLQKLDEKLMKDDEYLAMMTAIFFGENEDSQS